MREDTDILVVAESIDINDSSGTKGRVAFINNLKAIGFNPLVLHYTRRNVSIEGVKCIPIRERKFNILYLLSRVRRLVNRHFGIDLFKNIDKLIGNSFSFYNDSKSIAKTIKKYGDGYSTIITFSKGTSYRPHHAMLRCPEHADKWIAYIHDPFPYHCFPPPYAHEQPGHKQKEEFFKQVSELANTSIFPSQLLLEWMSQYFPKFRDSGIVIPHQQLNYKEEKLSNGLDFYCANEFNLLHAGNLLKERSPVGLVEGFKLFLERNQDAKKTSKLILVGNSQSHKEVLESYEHSIPEFCYHGTNVSYQEAAYLQNHCSINIILEAKAEISPFLPGKFPHCVFADKPILYLGPRNSEVLRLLGKNYRYRSEVDDPRAICELITLLYEQWANDKEDFSMEYDDLKSYLGLEYFREQVLKIK